MGRSQTWVESWDTRECFGCYEHPSKLLKIWLILVLLSLMDKVTVGELESQNWWAIDPTWREMQYPGPFCLLPHIGTFFLTKFWLPCNLISHSSEPWTLAFFSLCLFLLHLSRTYSPKLSGKNSLGSISDTPQYLVRFYNLPMMFDTLLPSAKTVNSSFEESPPALYTDLPHSEPLGYQYPRDITVFVTESSVSQRCLCPGGTTSCVKAPFPTATTHQPCFPVAPPSSLSPAAFPWKETGCHLVSPRESLLCLYIL